ncbi:MAG: YbbR-like domain-containing protein [Bacteroidaceae bacterium]
MFDIQNIKIAYGKFVELAKNFLLATKGREFFVFICLFVLSGVFWLLQTLNESYQTELTIPVELVDIPQEAVVTEDLPANIKIFVEDKGFLLMTYFVGSKLPPVVLDFMKLRTNGNHVVLSSGDLKKIISPQLHSSTKLIAVKPDKVEYYYSIGEQRKIPVELHIKVGGRSNYIVTDTVMQPDSVLAFAPLNILSDLKKVDTELAVFTNINDTVHRIVSLCPVKGVKFVPASVQVSLLVDLLTEKVLEIPIAGVGFPADKVLRTFPSKAKVRFLVPYHRSSTIRPADFRVEVKYSDLLNGGDGKCRPQVVDFPNEASHIRVEPTTLDFLIEQRIQKRK